MDAYKKLQAYSGNEPYIFVSYAHKDSEHVLPIIESLQARGFRIWFDQGIEAGTEWPQYIAEHLYASSCVLVFMSQSAANSHNCTREINFAIELKKELIVTHLEYFEMPLGMRMQLNCLQAIYRERCETFDMFIDELANAKILKTCQGKENYTHNDESKTVAKKENKKNDIINIIDKGHKTRNEYTIEELAIDFNISSSYIITVLSEHFEGSKSLNTYLTEDELKFFFDFITKENSVQSFDEYFTADAEAQYNLGNRYYNGEGVKKDYSEAVKWYKLSAEQGNPGAQLNLGNCYYNGVGVEKDYIEAVKWYKLSAEQGNPGAQLNIGYCYEYGKGVEKDYHEAIKWYTFAAEQGDSEAQFNLGRCYYNGESFLEWTREEKSRGYYRPWKYSNWTEAIKWLKLSAEQGNSKAQYLLGDYYLKYDTKRDYSEAVKWYKLSAEQGDTDAKNILGDCYYKGFGVEKDYTEAVKWYKLSAEQGNPKAQKNIGNCYCNGVGVEKDYTEAVKWYKLSAEQGLSVAQYELGECYFNGRGVERNYTKAAKWYKLSAEQGYEPAKEKMKHWKLKIYG